jgi:sporulation integral membrane protein YlbJ
MKSHLSHRFYSIHSVIKGCLLLFMIFMLLFPYATYQGASSGLLLWFHNILPNLLPFIIVSNLLVRLNITRQISRVLYPILGKLFRVSPDGCYPIAIGFLSGIPMGAKSTADLVTENRISIEEGQFLIALCNNASPMFILGYISITQLQLPHMKYVLFAIIYSSAILGAASLRLLKSGTYKRSERLHAASLPRAVSAPPASVRFSFEILDSSIMNGFEVITKIGGYIILFSILAQIINTALPSTGIIKSFLMGLFEITIGISQVCKSELNQGIKIVLVAVLTSFGGFSGIAQTKSVLSSAGLSMKSYILAKLISAVFALVITATYVILLL